MRCVRSNTGNIFKISKGIFILWTLFSVLNNSYLLRMIIYLYTVIQSNLIHFKNIFFHNYTLRLDWWKTFCKILFSGLIFVLIIFSSCLSQLQHTILIYDWGIAFFSISHVCMRTVQSLNLQTECSASQLDNSSLLSTDQLTFFKQFLRMLIGKLFSSSCGSFL